MHPAETIFGLSIMNPFTFLIMFWMVFHKEIIMFSSLLKMELICSRSFLKILMRNMKMKGTIIWRLKRKLMRRKFMNMKCRKILIIRKWKS